MTAVTEAYFKIYWILKREQEHDSQREEVMNLIWYFTPLPPFAILAGMLQQVLRY